MGSTLGEGLSSTRPPLFDGSNYDYWCSRMRSHLQAVDYVLWRIVKNGPLVPTTIQMVLPYLDPEETDEAKIKAAKIATAVEVPVTNIDEVDLSLLRESEIKKISLNAKAINILHNALCIEEYGRVKGFDTAKEIWDCLEMTHVGTSQVRTTKIRLLTKEYEAFEQLDGESLSDMQQRFNLIVNNLKALGKTISTEDLNGKIMEAVNEDYRPKICAITESKDIRTMPVAELMGSLMAEECVVAKSRSKKKAKQNLALIAAQAKKLAIKDDSDDDDEVDEEDMAMMTRQFRNYLRKKKAGQNGNFKSSFRRNDKQEGQDKKNDAGKCYECGKTGHFRSACPKLKGASTSRKAMKVTWDDDLTCSETEEEEEVTVNTVCLAANEVHSDTETCSSYYSDSEDEDIRDTFDALCDQHGRLLSMHKAAVKSNKSMTSRISSMEKEIMELREALKKKNDFETKTVELQQKLNEVSCENDKLKNAVPVAFKTPLTEPEAFRYGNHDKRGIGFKGDSFKENVLSPKLSAPSSSVPRSPRFSCTYCEKGNHISMKCPIRKLCELGTLIPDWKKPKWIVKNSTCHSHAAGPKDTWVPSKCN